MYQLGQFQKYSIHLFIPPLEFLSISQGIHLGLHHYYTNPAPTTFLSQFWNQPPVGSPESSSSSSNLPLKQVWGIFLKYSFIILSLIDEIISSQYSNFVIAQISLVIVNFVLSDLKKSTLLSILTLITLNIYIKYIYINTIFT